MIDEIVRKLNYELGQDIVSERQVVYILVEARKLLEKQGTLKNFPALKLCCDWAVHPKLDQGLAKPIVSYFDAYEEENRKSGIGVREYNFEPLSDFLSHRKFRAELMDALHPHGVEITTFANDGFWRSFILHYTSVIEDCPLEAKATNTKLVSHVSAAAWPPGIAESVFPNHYVVQWTWRMKDGSYPKSVCSLFGTAPPPVQQTGP